ncbi:hexosaminidase D-like isoform X2 [Lycorma delicatula]|uniref:hexosaminidase D-like isoform X2 n=1 Tax=Lycorma delicatula TaxID=130591 RepID=UPI003F5192D3
MEEKPACEIPLNNIIVNNEASTAADQENTESMKLAGSYAGRLWRRKSTILGAALAVVLLVLCLQYNSGKVVEVPPQPVQVEEVQQQRDLAPGFASGQDINPGRRGDTVDIGLNIENINNNYIPGDGSNQFINLDIKTPYVPPQRLLHLDLKGAPPLVSYLKRILSLAKELGATGVLLEWEDMFPWTGTLSPLAARNAYSRQEVLDIIETAASNQLEVIPLIQTFGHVEFALKYAEFADLREVAESPQALCPSLNSSLDLVHQMVDQIMEIHKGIRYLHIGCDEVFHMGECVRCRTQARETLFLNHVSHVAGYVRNKYPDTVPIIWDDMLRHLPPISLDSFHIGELVEPMVWVYAEDVYRFVPSSVWEKYATTFPRVWAASAFKGAFGETLYVPNVKRHLENNMRWLQVMSTEGPKFKGGFQGIAITGWQRYDHFAVLCELLPSAIPSLAVNLLVTSHGYFNQSLRTKLNNGLSCGVFAPSIDRSTSFLNLNNDPYLWDQFSRCVFPGHSFYKLLYRMHSIEREVAEMVNSVTKEKGWLTDYNVRHNFSSPLRVDELMIDHQRLYHSVTGLVRSAKEGLSEVFDMYTIAEWIEQRLYPMIIQLEQIERDATALKGPRTWPRRPLPILTDLERFGIPSSDSSPG